MKLCDIHPHTHEHGLVVRGEVVPEHMTRARWRYAHRIGLLVRIHADVSRVADAPTTPHQLILAAVLASAPSVGTARTMVSGRTAAFLLGVSVPWDDPIHIVVRARASPTMLSGVAIHRPTFNLDLTVVEEDEPIPRARLTRMLLDVAAWDPQLTSTVLEELIVKKLLTLDDAKVAVTRHSRQGRPGLTKLRDTVEAWALGGRPPDSVLEARFAALCAEYGLSGYEFQRPVGRFRPDFCWVREWLIVECDGFDGHGRRHAQSEADKARDAELTSQGWLVMRFTWHQITQRSAWVASSIRATLRRRAVQLGLNP